MQMMTFDREHLFGAVRAPLFPHGLTESQVAGYNVILAAIETYAIVNTHAAAYILATAYHETGARMQPVREVGEGRGRPYGRPDPVTGKVYYGRGLVQLTWKADYAKLGTSVGENLVSDPDLALDPVVSAKILVVGMIHGLFTGKKLADYFTGAHQDYVGARRIINGEDSAAPIAGYAQHFAAALIPAKATPAAAADATGAR